MTAAWWSRGAVLAVVVAATLAHQLLARDVLLSGKGDEKLYLDEAVALARSGPTGMRERVHEYLATPSRWLLPPPTRYGHYLAAAAACSVWGEDGRSLVRLSTIASLAALVAGTLLARRLGGNGAALLTAVLLGSSPLWLHLGRRALADAPHAAVALAAVWAFLEASQPRSRRRAALIALALLALNVATKETGLVLLAVLFAVHSLAAARAGTTPAAGPFLLLLMGGLLAWVGFSLLVGSPWTYARVVQALRAAGPHNPYTAVYHTGPWHRPLVDLALLSPGLVLLAPAALAWGLQLAPSSPRARMTWALAATTALSLVAQIAVSQLTDVGSNARYLALLDVLLRVVVAIWLAAWAARPAEARARTIRAGAAVALVLANALAEAWLFRRVFLERGVYDPVTDALARALDLAR